MGNIGVLGVVFNGQIQQKAGMLPPFGMIGFVVRFSPIFSEFHRPSPNPL